jgi:hypothetical protein
MFMVIQDLGAWNLMEQLEFSTMNMKVSICFPNVILILIFKLVQVDIMFHKQEICWIFLFLEYEVW